MSISETANKNHEELFPNRKSKLMETDPELSGAGGRQPFQKTLSRTSRPVAHSLLTFFLLQAAAHDIDLPHQSDQKSKAAGISQMPSFERRSFL